MLLLKRTGTKKTKPTRKAESDDWNWTLDQNYVINFFCMFWLRKKHLSYSSQHSTSLHLPVLCTTGKCHYKTALYKIIFFTGCNHYPFSWMMVAREATDIFPCWLWDFGVVFEQVRKADKQEQYSTSFKIYPVSQKALIRFVCDVQISGKLWITYFFSCKNVSCSLGWQICNSFQRAKQIK